MIFPFLPPLWWLILLLFPRVVIVLPWKSEKEVKDESKKDEDREHK